MIIDDPTPVDSELVVGIVAPIGTALDDVVAALRAGLRDFAYESGVIRLSTLLDDTAVGGPGVLPGPSSGREYYLQRMDAGDRLRERFESGDALAAYAISRIKSDRTENTGSNSQTRRYAWILRTVKHPDEVVLLRTVYGRRFLLIGVSAPESERIDYLTSSMSKKSRADAQALVERDERDERNKYGQQVRTAFSLADAFIEVNRGRAVDSTIRRVVGLIFGEPFRTPTREEYAMYHAQAAALRSAAFGRQVGAALATREGQIVALGTNEVPSPGGGEYWDGDEPDHRDHNHGRDFNKAKMTEAMAEILNDLRDAHWLGQPYSDMSGQELVEAALRPDGGRTVLGESRLRSLVEFGRIAHAEMSAINDAARRGVSTQSADLFTSTYPCHMCARIIINAGISRVVYIDPYAKSLVGEMYSDLVSSEDGEDHVQFSRFVGIAPPLYSLVFKQANRDVSPSGERLSFSKESARLRLAEADSLSSAAVLEQSVVYALEQKITALSSDLEHGPRPSAPNRVP